MIRALLNRVRTGNAGWVPTAQESITEAVEAVRAADDALAKAVDWTLPPMQPATDAEHARLLRLRAYTLTARAALEEATR